MSTEQVWYWLAKLVIFGYTTVLAILCVYGLHRYFLVLTFWRVRRAAPAAPQAFPELPRITVQLPMYNEQYVAERIIRAAGQLDYPSDKLQIQVLDDSTDETCAIARRAADELRAAGLNVEYIHRTDRSGYKAGALEHGLKSATGDFIAIFDADFLPPSDMLRRTIHYFTDPHIGMVQTRWEHLNRSASVLTQAQAILLDGHFVIEHTARNRSGRFMSFNGTAGVWRRTTIIEAGGWQHDTLTEDLDLSYRAQLAGWRFIFLPGLTAPAELPPEMNAFKAQQHRWTKGGAQTCLKLLPRVLRSPGSWRVKLEAIFHLTSGIVYILMVLLSLLMGPALIAKLIVNEPSTPLSLAFESAMFVIGFGSATIFYIVSQRELLRSWGDCLRYIPALMAVGIGIAFNNAIAALDGFFGSTGEFVRTPKFGQDSRHQWRQRLGGFRQRRVWQAYLELTIALYLIICGIGLMTLPQWFDRTAAALPFLLIFITGYTYVALHSLYTQWVVARTPEAS